MTEQEKKEYMREQESRLVTKFKNLFWIFMVVKPFTT